MPAFVSVDAQVVNASEPSYLERFGQGLLGALKAVTIEPVMQIRDMALAGASVVYNEGLRNSNDPMWFPDMKSGVAEAYASGTSQAKLLLQSNPITGVGVAAYDMTTAAMQGQWGDVLQSNPITGVGILSYDMTTAAMQGQWGDVAQMGGGVVGGLLIGKGVSEFGRSGTIRAGANSGIGVPVTRSANPLSSVLEFDAHGNEIMYRTMSREHYEHLKNYGDLLSTTETSISPSVAYSSKYDGVTVKVTVAPGTSAQLQEIGIAANKAATVQFPNMSTQTGSWMQTNARFKIEGGQMTTQLGQGKAIDIFNQNIVDFELVRKGGH